MTEISYECGCDQNRSFRCLQHRNLDRPRQQSGMRSWMFQWSSALAPHPLSLDSNHPRAEAVALMENL